MMALSVFTLFSGVLWVSSAEPSSLCSGDHCEGAYDSNILMQKRVEINDRVIAEDQMQAGAFDIKDFEKLDAEVEDIVKSGKRPEIENMAKIKKLVDAMLPELVDLHKSTQQELHSLSENVGKENAKSVQAQQNIKSTVEVQVEGARSNHSHCRVAEAPLNASKIEHYTALMKFVTEIALPAIRPTSSTPEMMGPYLKEMSEYFCPKHGIFVKLDNSSTVATKLYVDKRKTCNAYQTRFEADFCEWRAKLTDTCAAFSSAYKTAVKAYEDKEAATKVVAGTAEEQKAGTSKWKVEYFGIKKIICYVGVWMNNNDAKSVDNAKLNECKKDIDASPMNVAYPGVAKPVECSTTPVEKHPGTQGFLAEYAKLSQQVEPVMPCMKDVANGLPGGPAPPAPPAPTPAPPAPKPAPKPAPSTEPGMPSFPSPSPFTPTLIDQTE